MNLGLNSKVALVLGGSRGLGLACASELAAEGAHVVIGARDPSRFPAALERIRLHAKGNVDAIEVDARDYGRAASVVDTIVRMHGGLDILVNNAGGPPFGSNASFSDTDWIAAFEQNFLSTVSFTRAALPSLGRSGAGRVINIISSSVRNPIPGSMLSTSMRMGVVGFAKLLSLEAAQLGVTVNNVAAGTMLTDRVREASLKAKLDAGLTEAEGLSELAAQIPLRRLGDPAELGALVAFLASERASYINGATIPVDGGASKALL